MPRPLTYPIETPLSSGMTFPERLAATPFRRIPKTLGGAGMT
jgi:hypothetical protein